MWAGLLYPGCGEAQQAQALQVLPWLCCLGGLKLMGVSAVSRLGGW